jgi:hypothetical protein
LGAAPTSKRHVPGMKIFTLTPKTVCADPVSLTTSSDVEPELYCEQFAQMLQQRAVLPGFLGRRIRLDGLPTVTLDWLTLPGNDCFATFDVENLAIMDFLLIMMRMDRSHTEANLKWFVSRVVGGYGSSVGEDCLRHVRQWPAPCAVRFSLNPRPAGDHSINLIEHCFCDAFARVVARL